MQDESDTLCQMMLHDKEHCRVKICSRNGRGFSRAFTPVHPDIFAAPSAIIEDRRHEFSHRELSLIAWVRAVRAIDVTLGKDAKFQPFQNLMVLDMLVFLINFVSRSSLHSIIMECQKELNLCNLTVENIDRLHKTLQTKHSAYIVPRRHGKTTMLSGLLAATLLFIHGISIGYGCHAVAPLTETYNSVVSTMELILANDAELKRACTIKKTLRQLISVHNNITNTTSTMSFIVFLDNMVSFFLNFSTYKVPFGKQQQHHL